MGTMLEMIFRPQIFWTLWSILLIAFFIAIYFVLTDENKRDKEFQSIKGQLKDCILQNEELSKDLKATYPKETSVTSKVLPVPERIVDLKDFISSFAIEVWRLEKRVTQSKSSSRDNEESSLLQDQLQRIKDVLAKQEIEIQESTGTAYNDGMSLKVLHIEEVDSLPKGTMQIVETVKPTIYFKGEVICHGEIIVGKSKIK